MTKKNERDVRYFYREHDESWGTWMMDVKATLVREHGIRFFNVRNAFTIDMQTAIRIGQNADMHEGEAIGFFIESENLLRSDLVVVF